MSEIRDGDVGGMNKVVRGYYIPSEDILVFYEMYVNDRHIEPPEEYVSDVKRKLNVDPVHVYVF